MTDSLATTGAEQALREAVVTAGLAPSLHNTRPWRFLLSDGALEVQSDPSRRLPVVDPTGRQMVISCGCAMFNARVALAVEGLGVDVERFPDAMRPEVLARLTIGGTAGAPDPSLVALDGQIQRRHSSPQPVTSDAVPVATLAALVDAAAREGAVLVLVTEPRRAGIELLMREAQELESMDPACCAESHSWSTIAPDGARGATQDGGGTVAHDGSLLVLGTVEDTPDAWLRAGAALERVLLEASKAGLAARPLTQVVEVARTRAALKVQLELGIAPHVLVRVGHSC